jgi:hypothetical protein
MKMKRIALVSFMLLVAVLMVVAQQVTVQGISALNCGMIVSNTSCDSYFTVSCDVKSTAVALNSVKFYLLHDKTPITYNALLLSGNQTDGTYGTSLVVDGFEWEFAGLTVVDSLGTQCSGQGDVDVGLCKVRFTTNRSVLGNCAVDVCRWSTSTTCGADDVSRTTYTPTAACNEDAYTETTTCDYCTPDWKLVGQGCFADYNSSDPMSGVTTVKYVDSNDCFGATGLISDNQPPVSETAGVPCRKDYWLQDGKDASGQYGSNVSMAMTSSMSIYSAAYTGLYGMTKPVAFDVDNDGLTEIVFLIGSSFQVFDANMNLLRSVPIRVDAGTRDGFVMQEYAVAGFDVYNQGKNVVVDSTVGGSVGLTISAIAKTSSNDTHFVTYRFESGMPVQKLDVKLSAQGHDVDTGVICFLSKCYMLTRENKMLSVDWKTGSTVNVNPNNPSTITSDATVKKNQMPVLFTSTGTTPDKIAVVGQTSYSNTSNAAMFTCPLSLTSCDVQQIENITIDRISKLAVTGPALDGKYYLAFTTTSIAQE